MATTISNADSALKSVYLDVIKEQLNSISPFFSLIKKSTENVYGKEARKLVVHGFNGGIGVGDEDGNLPSAVGNKYTQFTSPLKNLYGVIEISDKALRASESNAGALVNLLNAEMEGLIHASTMNFSRMLFGDGSGAIAMIYDINGAKVKVTNTYRLVEGMEVVIYDPMNYEYEQGVTSRIVKSVNYDTQEVLLSGPAIDTNRIIGGCELKLAHSNCDELTGLEAIFNADMVPTLYGLNKAENPWMMPKVVESSAITTKLIQEMLDSIEAKSGNVPNIIITTWAIRRKLQELFASSPVVILGNAVLECGYKAMTINGIPVVVDRFCPEGYIYFLNTNDFELNQLCDWQWLEGDNGTILRQVPGKACYTATLVKYADLMCNRPGAQGLIKGIILS